MKKTILSGCIILITTLASGQDKYLTNEGHINFYSHTAIEDITANNNRVAAVIDSHNGEVAVIVIMNEFQFEKKLMQQHFNENYVESETYPKATFNGRIINNTEVDYQSNGTYDVEVEGTMTLHGVTREISAAGVIEVTAEGIVAGTKFLLNPEDYGIRIPRLVRNNIAENMEVTAELVCNPI